MAMQMRMNPGYTLVPETMEALVSFTDAQFVAGTVNRQVLGAAIAVTGSAGFGGSTAAQLGPDATLKPTRYSQPFSVFCNPNGAGSVPAANVSPLPIGLANTGVTTGSEYALDFSAFQSDITGAQASLIPNARNAAATLTVVVSAIDNVNKIVYINVVNTTSGALTANNATNTIVVDVQFVENGFTV